jgi:hypothetical protein
MLKRHIHLFIKLLLISLLILLFWFILSHGEAESSNTYVENPIKTDPALVKPTPTLKPSSTSKPTPTPKPTSTPKPTELDETNYLDKIKQWKEEYYYATKVWEFLRREGFSQEITCAIIGNMMIETSGGSLDLKPNIYSPDGEYYGLCQWAKEFYPEAHGLSFEQQLDFLLETIALEINTFGNNYKEGFDYKDFLAMNNTTEATLAFAKSYERCRPASYEMRQEAALKAYEYFDLERP